jgi:hypothetical protein
MNILCLHHGLYGLRIADNLRLRSPGDWQIEVFELPTTLPPIVDEPEEFLPPQMPVADLLLHAGETSQAAQLLPGAVRLTGARTVIAPIDTDTWIPPGLRSQLRRELNALGAAIVFPEPFCALTKELIQSVSGLLPGQKEIIETFNRYFGRPRLRVVADGESIDQIIVERGAACGASWHAAEKLRGTPLSEAVPKGGLISLHYPCLASMQPTKPKDGVENLMHLSGVIFNEEMEKALQTVVREDDEG